MRIKRKARGWPHHPAQYADGAGAGPAAPAGARGRPGAVGQRPARGQLREGQPVFVVGMPVHDQPVGLGAARCGDDQRAVAAHPDDGPLPARGDLQGMIPPAIPHGEERSGLEVTWLW